MSARTVHSKDRENREDRMERRRKRRVEERSRRRRPDRASLGWANHLFVFGRGGCERKMAEMKSSPALISKLEFCILLAGCFGLGGGALFGLATSVPKPLFFSWMRIPLIRLRGYPPPPKHLSVLRICDV